MADLSQLRASLDGDVLEPQDDGYEPSRAVWNAMVDRRPALVVRCTSEADVATAVRFAQAQNLEIGVLCGGHSVVGLCVPDAGLMIDLTPMNAVRVDPDRRRAWIQGGALLGVLDKATVAHGLATTAGNVSHTGVGGLTLGGGMGWLARQHGLSCDNVVSFDLVTAEGERVHASVDENPDLYWGLRGGGGNFGVVTQFEFQLHPLRGSAIVADLFFHAGQAQEVLEGWRSLLPEVPRQATLTAWVGNAGESPFLPPEVIGAPLASVGYVWVGDPAEGIRLIERMREFGSPVAERVAEMSYLELQRIEDSVEGHRWRRYWKGHYLRELPDAAIAAFLSRGAADADDATRAVLPGAGFQAYGGAIAEVGDDETAFSHRQALVEFVASARWNDPGEDQRRIAAARGFGQAMAPFASGAYVNALSDEGLSGVQRAYGPEKLARLAALKDRYDPGNVFHLNHNVPPGAPA